MKYGKYADLHQAVYSAVASKISRKKAAQARIPSPTRIKISKNHMCMKLFSHRYAYKDKIKIHSHGLIYLPTKSRNKIIFSTLYSVLKSCKQGRAPTRINIYPNKSLNALA